MDGDDKKASPPSKPMSSQMQAVVRLLAGQEERTLKQKMEDSNRPTWEQYKKDNEDKLNLEGMDQKKMEEYRAQLDEERDKLLARGTNHKNDSKKKKKKKKRRRDDDDTSDSDSEESRRKRKKHKKKRKKKNRRHHRNHDSDDGDATSSSSDEDSEDRRKKSKRKKKKRKKARVEENDGSYYRLSKFFDQGSDEE